MKKEKREEDPKMWVISDTHFGHQKSFYLSNGFDFAARELVWKCDGKRVLFTHKPASGDHFELNLHGHLHAEKHRVDINRDERHCLVSLELDGYAPQLLTSILNRHKNSQPNRQLVRPDCA